ncbi:glycosyltransferase [Myroides odoratimimus]|uniref:glycosyltransferase n=1 Tax=Myroides odoratimimus TaxID=76832 RepID=UPI002577D8E4|nr:glycosyltransferase [Myroides odoratimimus]MDM1398178.1 glycosyltransferase [Myroides odoratimimus]MEC4054521.1 glycosyltransferase [Myroides odoratimimus]
MKISVLISIYSEPIEWIKDALDSILYQTFQDFEIILVNDNPTRLENDILISEYSNKFKIFKYIRNEQNIGLTKSLNKGLEICEGEYIARMDADDICMHDRFEKQVLFMDANEDIVVCGAEVETFGKESKIIKFTNSSINIRDFFFIANPSNVPVAHPVAFIRKNVLDRYKIKYDEQFSKAQDFALWFELLKHGEISNLQDVLIKYRLSDSQISSKGKYEQINTRRIVYLRHVADILEEKKVVVPSSLNFEFYKIFNSNKNFIRSKISKNQYESLMVFFINNATVNRITRIYVLIKEYRFLFNRDLMFKEKMKCILKLLSN